MRPKTTVLKDELPELISELAHKNITTPLFGWNTPPLLIQSPKTTKSPELETRDPPDNVKLPTLCSEDKVTV